MKSWIKLIIIIGILLISRNLEFYDKKKFLKAKIDFEKNIDFSEHKTDIKIIALYLPQFHLIKENDEWWGKGFTEWTNVKKAKSLYKNHYQPRIPDSSFGYYDLSQIETIKKQVKLAKQHGIYGFAIYYYWFSGKKLLEKPIDMLLEHKDIDFPFMLIWANENWTRAWDGQAHDILIEQKYHNEDPIKFIFDLKKYLEDSRYIKVNGKPVIGLYEPRNVPNLLNFITKWRETARSLGIGEIAIWYCVNSRDSDYFGFKNIFDGKYEFPPRTKSFAYRENKIKNGITINYDDLIEAWRHVPKVKKNSPVFRGTMGQWDNSARRKSGFFSWINFSIEKFYVLTKITIEWTRRNYDKENRFIFMNAWNEWGEGTYLEPDKKYGYAVINSLSKAIFDLPFKDDEKSIVFTGCGIKNILKTKKVAVQAHIFYLYLVPEIVKNTNNIPIPFDLYVTTTSYENSKKLEDYLSKHSKANHFEILVVENKGRDIYPFLKQMKEKVSNYEYFCHIHTKKSFYTKNGNIWRNYLYRNLLGNSNIISEIISIFEREKKIGLIYPQNINFIKDFVTWGSDKALCDSLLSRLLNQPLSINDKLEFPAGSMFWARTKSIKQMFDLNFEDKEFPEEKNQIDGTIMHAIERIWLFLVKANGYSYRQVRFVLDNRPLFK